MGLVETEWLEKETTDCCLTEEGIYWLLNGGNELMELGWWLQNVGYEFRMGIMDSTWVGGNGFHVWVMN